MQDAPADPLQVTERVFLYRDLNHPEKDMIATEFFFVADRGTLKIYLLSKTSTPKLRLAETVPVNGARLRFAEEFTDQAGAFPVSAGNGRGTATAIAERQSLLAEDEARSLRQITAKIVEVLRANKPRRWSLAAPSAIHNALVDALPGELRATLSRCLKKDLVKSSASDVLEHFQKVQPHTLAA
jgi:hypothetical protein